MVALAAAAFLFFNAIGDVLHTAAASVVPLWLSMPFVLFLLAIATGPFLSREWWERRYPAVAISLGVLVLGYYVYPLGNLPRIALTFYDYVSFISLIGSLFVVSGGIHFNLRGRAAPWENVLLLASGALLSNILGTTGASMLLIRPYLRSNKYRIQGYHVVFFIFIVSNVGGALTPIGDPPLFLGYLKGVPFFWVITKAWFAWALVLGALLAIFYVVDALHFKRLTRSVQDDAVKPDTIKISGGRNFWFLAAIIAAVFVDRPLMLREIVMWGAALGSYYTTPVDVHGKNNFDLHPLREVAVLFVGIFATMIPALDWLELNAHSLGLSTPGQFFWWSGALSGVLDNAPTYLSFLSTAFGLHGASVNNAAHVHAMLGQLQPGASGLAIPMAPGAVAFSVDSWRYVQAVSIASVFFGAMTYIGNGPNFMVKAIADRSGVQSPSFLGYVGKYSFPILIPLFILVWFVLF